MDAKETQVQHPRIGKSFAQLGCSTLTYCPSFRGNLVKYANVGFFHLFTDRDPRRACIIGILIEWHLTWRLYTQAIRKSV